MSDLSRIVLLEARMESELANLARRHGLDPVSVPALREETADCAEEVNALIDALSRGDVCYIIFQTGVGAATLLDEAEKLNRRDELIEALKRTQIAARGPKPTAVLARCGLRPAVRAREPFTTNDLIDAMRPFDLGDKNVALLHYGEPNLSLAESLTSRGARLRELLLYEWRLPADTTRLTQLIDDLIDHQYTAIAFTSQIQARHIFRLAAEAGKEDQLRAALNDTLVASIGPTCTAALSNLGVEPRVEPERPKMGPLISAVAQRLRQSHSGC
ncbi:MAG TPA: uroporphyrinogen-III synthase [Blastocatellia bacterium]|nr:uroporphyrinogen-III synthase [Blastocatellia bacterium]